MRNTYPKMLMLTILVLSVCASCGQKETVVQPIAQSFDTEAENLWITENAGFAKVFEFVRANDLKTMDVGTYHLDGDRVYLIVMEDELKPRSEARLEVHDKYYDLQVPLTAPEGFGYRPRKDCSHPDAPMDTAKDIQFFGDSALEVILAEPMQFVVFSPEHAHAPMIGEGTIKKAVFKVKL